MDPITSDDQSGEVNLTILNAHTPDPVFRNQRWPALSNFWERISKHNSVPSVIKPTVVWSFNIVCIHKEIQWKLDQGWLFPNSSELRHAEREGVCAERVNYIPA